MRLTLNQELRQEQRQELRLTPQMIQSMEILQLPQLQLEQRINQELEKNPALELQEPDDEDKESSIDADDRDADHEANYAIEDSTEESPPNYEHEPEMQFERAGATEEFSIADEFAQNYSDTIDEAPVRSQNWLEEQAARRADAFANIASPGETLQQHLEAQLDWFDISEPVREMAKRIIHHLEPSGYFADSLEDFLGEEHTGEERELAAEALALVKRLEPVGVGSKDLRECLLLQVNPGSEYAGVLRVLITSCLEDIAANRLPAIAKRINFPLDTVQGAVAELRQFHPRPGAGFDTRTAAVVVPEIYVEKNESGKYLVRLEEKHIPRLRISRLCQDMLKQQNFPKDAKQRIRYNIGSARWLIEAVEQRRETLLRVSQAIVDHQTGFFEKGQQALKPLKMQQIADIVGMHVTTVSRACDEKWVSSPRGIFPLRRLFAGGLATADGGEDVANDAVRSKIQEIVDKENKKAPLSDDAIVQMLKSEGIQVARRTIAKYRDLLGIPSSRGRRQWET